MDKKIITIIILIAIIIGLVVVIFSGRNKFETIIESLQGQRISLVRSNEIVTSELVRSIGEVEKLETDYTELENNNTELTDIIDKLTAGSQKTENYLGEYRNINNDFAAFLRSAVITD